MDSFMIRPGCFVIYDILPISEFCLFFVTLKYAMQRHATEAPTRPTQVFMSAAPDTRWLLQYVVFLHLKLKSREISFAPNLIRSCQIILHFFTKYGNDTAVLCAKFKNDPTTDMNDMDERDIARFEFEWSFGGISYIATSLRGCSYCNMNIKTTNSGTERADHKQPGPPFTNMV